MYGQFESIEEVVTSIATSSVAELSNGMMSVDDASRRTPHDGVTTFAQRWISSACASPTHTRIALRFAPDEIARHLEETLTVIIERGVAAGAFAPAARQRLAMLRAATMEAARIALDDLESAPRVAEQLAALLPAACRAP